MENLGEGSDDLELRSNLLLLGNGYERPGLLVSLKSLLWCRASRRSDVAARLG